VKDFIRANIVAKKIQTKTFKERREETRRGEKRREEERRGEKSSSARVSSPPFARAMRRAHSA